MSLVSNFLCSKGRIATNDKASADASCSVKACVKTRNTRVESRFVDRGVGGVSMICVLGPDEGREGERKPTAVNKVQQAAACPTRSQINVTSQIDLEILLSQDIWADSVLVEDRLVNIPASFVTVPSARL